MRRTGAEEETGRGQTGCIIHETSACLEYEAANERNNRAIIERKSTGRAGWISNKCRCCRLARRPANQIDNKAISHRVLAAQIISMINILHNKSISGTDT